MKVYVVKVNADTIEGRGPMVLDKVFKYCVHAQEYIESTGSCYGERWNTYGSVSYYGFYSLEEVVVHEDNYDINEDKKQKALSKLTDEEKKLLELN